MGITRNIFKWIFENIAPGETTASKRVDGDRIMDNFEDISRAVRNVRARGSECAFVGSTSSSCVVQFKTYNATTTGLVDNGDWVKITDAAGLRFRVQASANDTVTFGNAQQTDGAAKTSGYDNAPWQAGLEFEIEPKPAAIGKSDLVLGGSSTERVDASVILATAAPGETDSIATKVTATKAIVDKSLDAGGIKAEAIANTAFNKAALTEESYANWVWGRMDLDSDGNGVADAWRLLNSPKASMSSTYRMIGDYSQKLVTTGADQGIMADPAYYNYKDFLGAHASIVAWVVCTNDDDAKVHLDDGITNTTITGGLAGVITPVEAELSVGALAAKLDIEITSTTATTFYVLAVNVSRGRLHKGYSDNATQASFNVLKTADVSNWILNGAFDLWTNDVVSAGPPVIRYPDFWKAGALPPDGSDKDVAISYYGMLENIAPNGFHLTMTTGESVVSKAFLIPAMVAGETGYLSLLIYGVAGTDPVRIANTISASYKDVVPTIGAWRQLIIPVTPSGSVSSITLTVSVPSGANEFVLSGVGFSRGKAPTAWKPCEAASIFERTYVHAGSFSLGDQFLEHHGAALDCFPVPHPLAMYNLVVKCLTAPGAGKTDTFTVYKNGAPTTIVATITGTNTTGRIHIPDGVSFAAEDLLGVYATLDGSGTSIADVGAAVEGIILSK